MQVTLPPNSTALVAGFHALSDPLRLAVIELLRSQELCVCDLCDRLKVSQSKLSFHLKTLKEADLILPRQDGRWIYYRLNPPQFARLEEYLADYQRFAAISSALPCFD